MAHPLLPLGVQSSAVYRFVPHTAELELELESETAEGVFQDALHAFAELLGTADGEELERQVSVDATDRALLLAGWLDELLFLAETEGLVPERAELELEDSRLRADVHGRRGAPRPLVKAVTLHRLDLRRRNGEGGPRWTGRVVLDV